MLKTYEETLVVLKEKGKVGVPLTDVDLQFFLEDSLDAERIQYQKFLSSSRSYSHSNSTKELIIEIVK